MSIEPKFGGLSAPRLPTDTEVRTAMARARRMQARAISEYVSAIGRRLRGNPNGRMAP